jgi:hypothetical protein
MATSDEEKGGAGRAKTRRDGYALAMSLQNATGEAIYMSKS